MIPAWLAGLTGADKFGTAAGANFGDIFQAAGHSMAQHYRGQGGKFGATDGRQVSPQAVLAGLGGQIEGAPLAPTEQASSLVPTPEQQMQSEMLQAAATARLNGSALPWGQIPMARLAAAGLRAF